MMEKQMNYFVAVVECHSFTEAAEACFISQSAISQQIRALEGELGAQLLIRENRTFHLTAAGEYFYGQCKILLKELQAVKEETKRLADDAELQLSIGYLKNYGGHEVHEAVREFTRTYPEVSIHIVNGNHEKLYELLRTGQVDLVLNDQRRAFSDEYVNFELAPCDCYIELSARNSLAKKKWLTRSDLKKLPCILIATEDQQKNEQGYYEITLGFGSTYLFADNLEEGRMLVLGNRGFMPVEGSKERTAAEEAIARLPLYQGNKPIQRKYCAFWKKDNSGYYVEEFATILKKSFNNE